MSAAPTDSPPCPGAGGDVEPPSPPPSPTPPPPPPAGVAAAPQPSLPPGVGPAVDDTSPAGSLPQPPPPPPPAPSVQADPPAGGLKRKASSDVLPFSSSSSSSSPLCSAGPHPKRQRRGGAAPPDVSLSELVKSGKFLPPDGWSAALCGELQKSYFGYLTRQVDSQVAGTIAPAVPTPGGERPRLVPSVHDIMRPLRLTPLDKVRVVIVSQLPGSCGLPFDQGGPLTPALSAILNEVRRDVGGADAQSSAMPDSVVLDSWAEQGVLLLPSVFTGFSHDVAAHARLGWQNFSDAVLEAVSAHLPHGIVFLLFGGFAQEKARLVSAAMHVVLRFPHPLQGVREPRQEGGGGVGGVVQPPSSRPVGGVLSRIAASVYRRVFGPGGADAGQQRAWAGCSPFSQCNHYLALMGRPPIDWMSVFHQPCDTPVVAE